MKVVHNKSNNLYIVLNNAITFQVLKSSKEINKVFAIIICMPTHNPTPIAFYSNEEEAKDCLRVIVEYFLDGTDDILEIEDNIEESLLLTPDSVRNN